MKTVQSKDGTIIAYDILGEGPPLIFITGATCFRSFEPVMHDAQIFAKQFSVYNYDRRGRGDSSNTVPYSIDREIEDIEALIDAAGGTACLYGHSSGAILALEAALRLGGKITNVTLYDPAYASDPADQVEFKRLGQRIEEMLANSKNEEAIQHFLEGIGLPAEAIAGMSQLPSWGTMVALAPTLAYDIKLAGELPPVDRASRLNVPAQIIVGEHNPLSMHETAEQLKVAIPNAHFTLLEGQDHMPDPETVLPLLERFLHSSRL